MIYLDYAASSPPYPQVLQEISAVAAEAYGNPGALHNAGAKARQTLQNSRLVLAQMLNVRPEEIHFTSGGTEANNWAIQTGTFALEKSISSALLRSTVPFWNLLGSCERKVTMLRI